MDYNTRPYQALRRKGAAYMFDWMRVVKDPDGPHLVTTLLPTLVDHTSELTHFAANYPEISTQIMDECELVQVTLAVH